MATSTGTPRRLLGLALLALLGGAGAGCDPGVPEANANDTTAAPGPPGRTRRRHSRPPPRNWISPARRPSSRRRRGWPGAW